MKIFIHPTLTQNLQNCHRKLWVLGRTAVEWWHGWVWDNGTRLDGQEWSKLSTITRARPWLYGLSRVGNTWQWTIGQILTHDDPMWNKQWIGRHRGDCARLYTSKTQFTMENLWVVIVIGLVGSFARSSRVKSDLTSIINWGHVKIFHKFVFLYSDLGYFPETKRHTPPHRHFGPMLDFGFLCLGTKVRGVKDPPALWFHHLTPHYFGTPPWILVLWRNFSKSTNGFFFFYFLNFFLLYYVFFDVDSKKLNII